MPHADVSIVVPTRNRPGLAAEALASIARQTFENYEVFVVDDGSAAEHAAAYRALVEGYGKRFHLVQPLQPGQSGSGPAVTRNRGIFAGTGRYVAFLDDDDLWIWDDHLRVAVETLDKEGTDLYSGDMQGFQGDRLLWDTWFPERAALVAGARIRTDPPIYRSTRGAFARAATHRALHLNTMVVRRQLIDRTGGLLPGLRFSEDAEFVLRLTDGVDYVLFCEKPVARYRFPIGDSHSLTMQLAQQHLQTLTAAQHLRVVARSPEVRDAGRRMQAWTLRLLSTILHDEGRWGTAMSFALQALATDPTPGTILHIARLLLPGRPKA